MVWRDLAFCFVVCALGLAFCAAAASLAGGREAAPPGVARSGSPVLSDAIVQQRPTWHRTGSPQSRR